MSSVNKMILLGNLGKDPELRYTPSGAAVASFSVATSRKWKTKEGEKQEETEWHKLVAYDQLAEIIGKYLTKGKTAYFEGRLKTRKWQDKEGADRYTTEIVVEQMQMLGGRDDGAERPAERPQARQSAPPARSAAPARQAPAKPADDFDDIDF